jgi:hypothetical protein
LRTINSKSTLMLICVASKAHWRLWLTKWGLKLTRHSSFSYQFLLYLLFSRSLKSIQGFINSLDLIATFSLYADTIINFWSKSALFLVSFELIFDLSLHLFLLILPFLHSWVEI